MTEKVFNGTLGTIIHYNDATHEPLYVKAPLKNGVGPAGVSIPRSDLVEFIRETDPVYRNSYSLRKALRADEKRIVINALRAHNGNRTHTAHALGISRRTLLNRIRFHGIDIPSPQSIVRAEKLVCELPNIPTESSEAK